MELSVRRVKSSTGERFAILVDKDGMPLFYPSLYVTGHMRGRSLAINTIQNALNALKAFYAWQNYHGTDIEERFSHGKLLLAHEVHSLRDFMQRPLAGNTSRVIASQKHREVSTGNQYARMSVIADYLGFLAGRLFRPTNKGGVSVEEMVAQIKSNRPKISKKSEVGREERHLDDAVLDVLEDVLRPGSSNNPVREYAVQVRNALMFSLLRTTGLRRGELLNVKVEDVDFAKNTLKIVRRPDSNGDARTYQPVAKTRERIFPLMPELTDRIREYVTVSRAKVPGSKKHGYLFITHRAGRHQGMPLSNSGFGKFMADLRGAIDQGKGIHAHALRHHWNYSFSISCDSQGLTPGREEKIRSYLMGWSETSGTAAVYNRRHIKEKAGEALLQLQVKRLRKVRKEGDS